MSLFCPLVITENFLFKGQIVFHCIVYHNYFYYSLNIKHLDYFQVVILIDNSSVNIIVIRLCFCFYLFPFIDSLM